MNYLLWLLWAYNTLMEESTVSVTGSSKPLLHTGGAQSKAPSYQRRTKHYGLWSGER